MILNENSAEVKRIAPWDTRATTYRKRWLGRPPKRAITERKLEDEATQLTGKGVFITGSDAPQVVSDMLEVHQVFNRLGNRGYRAMICNRGVLLILWRYRAQCSEDLRRRDHDPGVDLKTEDCGLLAGNGGSRRYPSEETLCPLLSR